VGEIIESSRRHYVGDDADKDLIPAAGKSFGDSYHANDKGKQYYWDGTAWKTGLGYEYVPRYTDLVGDWNQGSGLTENGAWQADGLNCAAKGVTLGAKAIHFILQMSDDAAGTSVQVRQSAASPGSVGQVAMQVAGVGTGYYHYIVHCDENRLLDYAISAGITAYVIIIAGWYI